ncbi:hypothetical protein Ngar_c24310 [Candidatus Nitrososphaera gargensis Ga9.2]|uniref:Uncharacterized protein n=1 Tax=Nitrososphaera gargensis (strain Ga9.2) TaxID=1237085 RepID=K0IHE6_NITGG|nr:hypothetical protein Ngar_c24310 [Candidatus Nitrososphaera gargensis Ga9.2]
MNIIERLRRKQIYHNVQRNVLTILLICAAMTGATVSIFILLDILLGFEI